MQRHIPVVSRLSWSSSSLASSRSGKSRGAYLWKRVILQRFVNTTFALISSRWPRFSAWSICPFQGAKTCHVPHQTARKHPVCARHSRKCKFRLKTSGKKENKSLQSHLLWRSFICFSWHRSSDKSSWRHQPRHLIPCKFGNSVNENLLNR